MKKNLAVLFCLSFFAIFARGAYAAEPPVISFDFVGDASVDLSFESLASISYPLIDESKYPASAGKYLISDMTVPLKSGNAYRLLLTCAGSAAGGSMGIQIVIADERRTPAGIIQKIELGDGLAPQILPESEAPGAVMFRAIRAGNVTEARVYLINHATGRLDEALVIGHYFPQKMKLKVKGKLEPGGRVELESANPRVKETLDLSPVFNYLVEDEIYQSDGNPIPALENLRLVRGGWEDESIRHENGETVVEIGLSLITLSEKTIANAAAVLRYGKSEHWTVESLTFEPSMPYSTE
ncbi:MAG: hypothetical protein LBU13_05680 [Synergistaceae bacterium]|jgi:hypothetical protein|nr:hypothetical protein [Synergistaceae bacterium]